MDTPIIINLDLTDCKYLGEMHQRIEEAFDFEEYYGQNWSAFWDLLRGTGDNTIVEIKGLKTMSVEFEPYINKMIELLQRNKDKMLEFGSKHPEFDCRFEYRIID